MKRSIFLLMAAMAVVIFWGCSKTNDYGNGRLVIKLTDAPFPISDVESATVKITKVELRKAGDGIPDGNPFIVVSEDAATFDLIQLRNGVVEKLIDIEIPQGEYDLVRLYVDEAGLKVKGGDIYSVKVPSGQQTGIKVFIRPSLIVEGGLTSELLLDFDLSRSFVMRGNMDKPSGMNGFIFKPVVRAVNNTTAGRIEGFVKDTAKVKIREASVWVAQDTVVATAVADTMGYYAIIGLPAGLYSVFAAKEDYDTAKVEDVRVTRGNRTIVNFTLEKEEE